MNIGIMQPYFFPYPGHFALILHTEHWVVFDVTQYTKKSWLNRNRVLHPKDGWTYIQAPLQNSTTQMKIMEARIKSPQEIFSSLMGKLSHYKGKAPYYQVVIDLLQEMSAQFQGDSLSQLNAYILLNLCRYLSIPINLKIFSELNLTVPNELSGGDWAFEISKTLGVSTYINPISGRHLFSSERFKAANIDLKFLDFTPLVYPIKGYTFIENLSILDVMMWCSPQWIKDELYKNTHLVSST